MATIIKAENVSSPMGKHSALAKQEKFGKNIFAAAFFAYKTHAIVSTLHIR